MINKSDSHCTVVRFCYHSYDYRPNWTPLSPITITYHESNVCSNVYAVRVKEPCSVPRPLDAFSSRDNSSIGVVTRITPGGIETSSSSDSDSCLYVSMWFTSVSRGCNCVDEAHGDGTARGGGIGSSPW